jgi:hypothetical protein
MPVWGWVLVGVAAVVVVAVVAVMVVTRRRSAVLREQFGPEYERTVESTGERRGAEAELRERQQRREQFRITPLAPAARERYQEDWRLVQSQFVDDPATAVGSADRLIQSVMRERGYPVEDFDQRADDLSVDYPDVVQNYREGRQLSRAGRDIDKGSTEDLRRAFRCYRALFDELVGAAESTTGSYDASTGQQAGVAPSRDSAAAAAGDVSLDAPDRGSEPVPSRGGSREQGSPRQGMS